MTQASYLFYHAPCFDGIASAVVAVDYLEGPGGWLPAALRPHDNEARRRWLETPLPPDAAVVDFPYHPQARFWADHHQTAFLSPSAEASFRSRRREEAAYDPAADSCAGVLWRHFFAVFRHRNSLYEPLVSWADKIDGARYGSVEEALEAPSPALVIAASLAEPSAATDYSIDLVRALRVESLDQVAGSPEVKRRYDRARALQSAGLARMRESIRLLDGIAVFDVDADGVVVNRYSPYRFFPDADYSIGILRSAGGAKISAMRNPWKEFESVPLGRLFQRYGGGGHRRVASLYLSPAEAPRAPALLREILQAMQHAAPAEG